MRTYLAFDGINYEYEKFYTLEEAQEWLKESFLNNGEYHPDLKDCAIYKLLQKVDYDITDKKSDHSEEEWEEIAFNPDFEELWKHKFVDVEFSKYVDALPKLEHVEQKIEDYNSSHSSYPPIIRNTYEDGFRACFNWIHRIVSKLD